MAEINRIDQLIEYNDLLYITEGHDRNGFPLAAGALQIDEIYSETESKQIDYIYLRNGVYHIRAYGGCAVVTVDIPPEDAQCTKAAAKLCEKWFAEIENPEYDNQLLSLVVTPLIAEGMINLVFQQLVWFDTYKKDRQQRIVFAFNGNATGMVVSDEINFRQMIAEAKETVLQKENELRESIVEAEMEKEAYERENNPFAQELRAEDEELFRVDDEEELDEYNGYKVSEGGDDFNADK